MYGKFKKHKENVDVTIFNNKGKHGFYNNTLTRDPNAIAQIFIDLMVLGFPIVKAIKKFNERLKNKKDWMGI